MMASPISGDTQHDEMTSVADVTPPWKISDRVHEYVIEKGQLNWRPLCLSSASEWTPIALPDGRIPYQVKADWENLMVLDSEGDVHYAKSMDGNASLIDRLTWQKGIWNLPVISAIYNLIVSDPNFGVGRGEVWGCSYLESGSFYVDGMNNPHPLGDGEGMIEGTTTAYVADHESRCFRYYDPYIPPWAENKEVINIPFPEKTHSTFELKGFASCRSQLFLVGYDERAAEQGGVEKSLALYTISADANLRGLNPGISYTYSMEKKDGNSFVLPASRYRRLPIPDGRITSLVGIQRAPGRLMTDVVFTIEGELNDAPGFFYLYPGADQWQFKESETRGIEPEAFLEQEYIEEGRTFSSGLQDWIGNVYGTSYSATLRDFGPRAMESYITVEGGEETYRIPFHIRESQWNLVMFDWTENALVIPRAVRDAFGWDIDEVVPVFYENEGNGLVIKAKNDHRELFFFGFQDVVDPEKRNCSIL